MADLTQRIAQLSPEKRELLLQHLRKTKKQGASLTPIRPRDQNITALPLSFTQQRLWFLDRLEPGQTTYNIGVAIRLQGSLDVTALEQSLTQIIARHEILRTTFYTVDGQPVQRILSPPDIRLETIDLSALPPADRAETLDRLATAEAKQPFNLTAGPLLRFKLLILAGDDHLLLLTMHHTVSDGWSLSVFYKELSIFYNDNLAGTPPSLSALPIQFADFALWQRGWLAGDVLEQQLAYWKKQLEGAASTLALPLDHPRPPIQRHRGAQYKFELPKTLTDNLKDLSRQQDATLYMVLLAAFKTLLYRYTGQDDILVGTPIANRTRVETESLIGFFANTLVLRTDLSDAPSFQELLGRVRRTVVEAQDHQDLPFERLIEVLQPERDLSRNPLFQVMFILQNVPTAPLALTGLTTQIEPIHTGTAKFDLTLSLTDTAGGLQGAFEYDLDLFDAATIARMSGHFETLLTGIAADPVQPIAQLPLLTGAERRQMLVTWNQTDASYPAGACFPQLFEAQVEQTPEAVAVTWGDKSLTYRELNCRANQLAYYLQQQGVGPEMIVGVCLERSPELLIGLLGLLKAGGAYVPFDPTYPTERLAFMIEDTQTPLLLTQAKFLAGLPAGPAQVICLDTAWDTIAQAPAENLVSRLTPANLAYVIYTSGSTGRPKGVLVEQRSLVNYLTWVNHTLLQEGAYHLPTLSRLTFDASLKQLLAPLLRGDAVWLVPEDTALRPQALLETLDHYPPAGINCVPALWKMLLDEIEANPARWPVDRLGGVYLGGEALSQSLVQRSLAVLPHLNLWNLYGPTEATSNATAAPISPDGPVTIGRPIANMQAYILDRHLQPAPVGVAGELYLGGVGLARGYLNRPELTAERFITNPFTEAQSFQEASRGGRDAGSGAAASPRLYKTGDLARYRPDGSIEFLGRVDHQVKIRGFRIEPGEIETALTEHTQVREALVLARESERGQQQLVAYVTGASPSQATPQVNGVHLKAADPEPLITELRRHLKQKLPDYMLPNVITVLDHFPLTSTGKIDREALPDPAPSRYESAALTAPRDIVELQLTKLWEQILGVRPVGLDDNFFEMGGHSMLAVRLLIQIEAAFKQKLPLATLFQTPTIAELAQVLRREKPVVSTSSLVALQVSGSKPPIFCVPGILGNVFIDLKDLVRHLEPDQPVYGFQDGPQNPTRIKSLASLFIEEMQTIQPEGPYRLAGICFGGVIAFEMAQQLQARHQKVEMLALIEPSPPPIAGLKSYMGVISNLTRRLFKRFSHHLDNFAQRSPVEQQAYLGLKRKLVGNMWARAGYTVHPYAGSIMLFLTKETLAKAGANHYLDWPELALAGAKVIEIPGSHNAITGADDTLISETSMRELAKALNVYLDADLTNFDFQNR